MISRIKNIERQLRIYRAGCIILLLVVGAVVCMSTRSNDDILRVKGLIIEDAQGRARIIMGAPAPKVPGRTRTDDFTGIAYMDENGADRLTFGKEPDPMTAGGIKPRYVGGVGILIHDKAGVERGGYGVLDDDRALLTLDWPKTGEALALSADDHFAAIGLFHWSKPGVYREALTMGVIRKSQQSFLKITDTGGTEQLRVQTDSTQPPLIKQYNSAGKEIYSRGIH